MSNRIITQRARRFTASIGVIIDPETGTMYQLASGEKLVFGIKNSKETSEYILRKELTSSDYDASGGYELQLTTSEMDFAYGTYYYDVALQRSNGELETVIPLTEFEVAPSVVRQAVT